jgi:hypothetical protein
MMVDKMIQQTSLEVWQDIKPYLSNKQSIVYSALLALNVATNKDLSCYLNWPINSITPRVLELRKLGMVIENQVIIQNNRSAIQWRCI